MRTSSRYCYRGQKVNKELAQVILNDLHYTLDNQGISHWLFFGTLLGAYRNNDFLSDDIDIVCDYKDYWKVRELFAQDKSWEINCIWSKEIALWKYGRKIDILFADVETENTYLYIYKPNLLTGKWHTEQRYTWLTQDIFPLQYMQVFNHSYLIPANPKNIFRMYYGETWNIPDPNWNRTRNPAPNLDLGYRQIAVLTNNAEQVKYFTTNYPSDWIRVYSENEPFKETLILLPSPKLDLTKVYNLQSLIDILNQSENIFCVTTGNLTNPQISLTSRSLVKGHKFEEAKDLGDLTLVTCTRKGTTVKTSLQDITIKVARQ